MPRKTKDAESVQVQLDLDKEDCRDVDTLVQDDRQRDKDRSIGRATMFKRYGMPAIRRELMRRGLPTVAPVTKRAGERRLAPAGGVSE